MTVSALNSADAGPETDSKIKANMKEPVFPHGDVPVQKNGLILSWRGAACAGREIPLPDASSVT